jgi:hypothetical protein
MELEELAKRIRRPILAIALVILTLNINLMLASKFKELMILNFNKND